MRKCTHSLIHTRPPDSCIPTCPTLTTSKPPHSHYGSLEETIRAIRAHRPFDLNAERWREAHDGADFETWRQEAHRCLHDGLHYDPGQLNLCPEDFDV